MNNQLGMLEGRERNPTEAKQMKCVLNEHQTGCIGENPIICYFLY